MVEAAPAQHTFLRAMGNSKPGDCIAAYELRRELGQGAMATVFEAEHLGLGKRVALKRMHPHLATDETAASRFLREGRAAAQIRSPHVVDVFDVGTHEGVPYLVMELLAGEDLASVLRRRGKLPLSELADVVVPIALAVHMAHEAGVIHRDLKPSNVVLATRDGGERCPVVLDFGISKLVADAGRDLTASEVLLGTVHYMSPEQTRSGRQATALSDQYALGVLLYECATGAKPFAGSTHYAVMHAIVSARVVPPSGMDPALPPAFDDVVLRAMQRDPRKRFESVRGLGAALLPWASAETRLRYAAELGVDAAELGARASRGASVRSLGVWLRPLASVRSLGDRLRSLASVRSLAGGAAAVALVGVVAIAAPSRRSAPRADATAASNGLPGMDERGPPQAASSDRSPSEVDLAPTSPGSVPSLVFERDSPSSSPPSRPAPRRRAAPSGAPAPRPPERGTNGALILE
jgi:serine/threonine-protein kinase